MLTSLLVVVDTLIGDCAPLFLPQDDLQAFRRPTIVDRAEWGARAPRISQVMANPVPYVVIHHTYSPGACDTEDACVASVRSVQDFHMDTRGWADIGYSFLVGGDNRAYKARGWSKVGAHAIRYNRNSIGIAAIGNWTDDLPPEAQLHAIQDLIAYGVELGRISPTYRLIGHRQAGNAECPGARLYGEIQTWPRWYAA